MCSAVVLQLARLCEVDIQVHRSFFDGLIFLRNARIWCVLAILVSHCLTFCFLLTTAKHIICSFTAERCLYVVQPPVKAACSPATYTLCLKKRPTFTTCYNFYSAPQCSHCERCTSYGNSVRLSVCLSVTRRYCVKTTARSTVQFALSDSKMCLVL